MKDFSPVQLKRKIQADPLLVSFTVLRAPFLTNGARDLKVIGIVRRGMNFGLLATDESGGFFRVNGSYIEPLVQRAVMDAVRRCREAHPHRDRLLGRKGRSGGMPSHQVSVSFRIKRQLVLPELS